MRTPANILFKRATAFLLLLLMVGIHVTKLHHHHTGADSRAVGVEKGYAITTEQSVCAICDYHFTKDCDHSATVIAIARAGIYSSSPAAGILTPVNTISSVFFLRGPPACV